MLYTSYGRRSVSITGLVWTNVAAQLAWSLLGPSAASAAPLATVHKRQQPPNPDSSNGGGGDSGGHGGKGISAQVWVPIVVVAVLLLLVATLSYSKKGWRFKLGNWSTAAAIASGTVVNTTTSNREGTVELTAELLAGASSPATTPAATPAARPRRSRRNNRRTGSMISTRSLPMYMKEPGDEELVIYRGPSDMEDMPENMMNMPAVEEGANDSESPDSSLNMSRTNTREYGLMPDSPHNMPLLHPDDLHLGADMSGQTLVPPSSLDQLHNRPSFETLLSTDGSDEQERQEVQDRVLDPRGDAPPYFEVVAMDELNATISRASEVTNAIPEEPNSAQSQHSLQPSSGSRRRSIFGFLHRSGAASPPPVPGNRSTTAHARTDSGPSVLSMASTSNDGHPRPRSRSRHRPSQSTSNGSVFSLSSAPFRTISRQRSNIPIDPRLNSASMISLDSISSPLTHTLVRTEFTYPKSGPTPEQLKLISSRETFARFGVPYGPDAIAYHASQSRVDLAPPPGFDEITGESPGAGAGASESTSSGADQAETNGNATPSDDDHNNEGGGSAGEGMTRRPSLRITVVSAEGSADQPAGGHAPSTGEAADLEAPVPSRVTGGIDERPAEQVPLPPSPSLSRAPSASPPHPPPGLAPASSTSPPSAFKGPSTTSSNPRSESRASSYLSFATAEESIRSSSPPPSSSVPSLEVPDTTSVSDANESPATTAPPTPRLTNTRHVLEGSDMTATPSTPTVTPATIPVH